MTEATEQLQTEVPAEQKQKTKHAATGDVIVDTAAEIESLSKQKVTKLIDQLIEDSGSNDFKLGGLFLRVQEQGWYDGFESFDAYVVEKFGFQVRKAYYLIDIYKNLVTKNIPWEKVAHLKWTKLRDLAPVLTLENLDEWVKQAENLSVNKLRLILTGEQAQEKGESNVEGTSDVVTFKIKMKKDQLEVIQNAIFKGKAELGTTFDEVALEAICAGFLAGSGTVVAPAAPALDLKAALLELGWEPAIKLYTDVYAGVDVSVTDVNEVDPTKPKADKAPATAPEAEAP